MLTTLKAMPAAMASVLNTPSTTFTQRGWVLTLLDLRLLLGVGQQPLGPRDLLGEDAEPDEDEHQAWSGEHERGEAGQGDERADGDDQEAQDDVAAGLRGGALLVARRDIGGEGGVGQGVTPRLGGPRSATSGI